MAASCALGEGDGGFGLAVELQDDGGEVDCSADVDPLAGGVGFGEHSLEAPGACAPVPAAGGVDVSLVPAEVLVLRARDLVGKFGAGVLPLIKGCFVNAEHGRGAVQADALRDEF